MPEGVSVRDYYKITIIEFGLLLGDLGKVYGSEGFALD